VAASARRGRVRATPRGTGHAIVGFVPGAVSCCSRLFARMSARGP